MRTNGTPNGPAACASSHRQRRKWWTALAVLAVLVVLGTVAALTMPASTMSVADMATPETAAAENGQAADAPARDPNAAAPAENTPDETAPAATPAPATPESAAPAAAEYTAALGEGADALNVVVTAPAGAFDEGVEPVLQVTALESEQDLQAIAAELDGHEVAYDGFAALDITFTDAQGQEIEPKLPVKVRMELPQAVVDSGIDLTTLTVQHLAEDDQGNVTSVDQVASVAGNTITLSDAAAAAVNEAAGIATMSNNALTAESAEAPVVAEFEVDGFSSFVITWGERSGWSGGYNNYFQLNMYYTDENGKEFTVNSQEDVQFNLPEISDDSQDESAHENGAPATASSNVVNFDKYAVDLSAAGYQDCTGIYYGNYNGTHQVASAKIEVSGTWKWNDGFKIFGVWVDRGWTVENQTYTLYLYQEKDGKGGPVDTLTYNGSKQTANIYYVYPVDPNAGPSFDITWENGYGQTSVNVEVYTYNTETGRYVKASQDFTDEVLKSGDEWTAMENAPSIEGYTLTSAQYYYLEDGDDHPQKGQSQWGTLGLDTPIKATGRRNNWAYTIGNYSWAIGRGGERTLRLYYDPQETGSGGEYEEPTPGHSKTATLNEDGSYDLTLSVTGSVGSQTNQAKVDLLMIVDASASMNNSRMTNAKTAMQTLVNNLESKQGVDARYSIVTFSGSGDATDDHGSHMDKQDAAVVLDWTSVRTTGSDSNVAEAISNIRTVGGTDYQAGIDVGGDQLDDARSDATKIVIFLSDGAPTWSYNDGRGSSGYFGINDDGWDETLRQAEELQSCTYFYTVGIGIDDSDADFLKQLNNKVTTDNKYQGKPEKGYYISADSTGSNLTDIFDEIIGNTIDINVSGVHISDTLSNNVEAILDDSGQPVKLVVTVTKPGERAEPVDVTGQIEEISVGDDGKYATGADYIYPTFNSETDVLELHFPSNYKLQDDYTYAVTLQIQPSVSAEMDYAQRQLDQDPTNDAYPDNPDDFTGTHADRGEDGYFSNVGKEKEGAATLTYTVEGETEPTTVKYDMPVVQVQHSYLKLEKKMADGTAADDTTFNFTLAIPAELAGTYNIQYSDARQNPKTLTFSVNEDTPNLATATVDLKADQSVILALPAGTQVLIAETTTGYTATWTVDGETAESGVVNLSDAPGQATTVTCTNTRSQQFTKISFRKVAAGTASTDDPTPLSGAQFKLYYLDGDVKKYYAGDKDTETWINSVDGATTITSDENGYLTDMPELEMPTEGSREYYLQEVVAPAGYQLPEHDVQITVTQDPENIQVFRGSAVIKTDTKGAYLIPNSTGVELPETGGRGTNFLTIGGLLMMAAAAGGYVLRRRRGKEAR